MTQTQRAVLAAEAKSYDRYRFGAEAARAFGVSPQLVSQAATVLRYAADQRELLMDGVTSLREGYANHIVL